MNLKRRVFPCFLFFFFFLFFPPPLHTRCCELACVCARARGVGVRVGWGGEGGGDRSQFAVAGCCPFALCEWLMNYEIINQAANRIARHLAPLLYGGWRLFSTKAQINSFCFTGVWKMMDWRLVSVSTHTLTRSHTLRDTLSGGEQPLTLDTDPALPPHRCLCGRQSHLWALT